MVVVAGRFNAAAHLETNVGDTVSSASCLSYRPPGPKLLLGRYYFKEFLFENE